MHDPLHHRRTGQPHEGRPGDQPAADYRRRTGGHGAGLAHLRRTCRLHQRESQRRICEKPALRPLRPHPELFLQEHRQILLYLTGHPAHDRRRQRPDVLHDGHPHGRPLSADAGLRGHHGLHHGRETGGDICLCAAGDDRRPDPHHTQGHARLQACLPQI